MRTVIILAISALALSACQTMAPYGPAAGPSAQGYSEQRIQSNRYRVTYRGVGDPGPVHNYALLRAADLTQEAGYQWFEIEQAWVDGRPDSAGGFRPSIGVGYGSGRYNTPYGRYSSSGGGVGVGLNFTAPSATSASIEIVMGNGERPTGAYDAVEVRRNLAAVP